MKIKIAVGGPSRMRFVPFSGPLARAAGWTPAEIAIEVRAAQRYIDRSDLPADSAVLILYDKTCNWARAREVCG